MKVRIIVRIKNEHFCSARKEAGFKYITDLALATGISAQTLYHYENFAAYPQHRNDKAISRIIALEIALNKNIEELFPPEHKIAVDQKIRSKIEFIKHALFLPTAEEIKLLPSADNPEEETINKELQAELKTALESLTSREAKVLEWRFGLDGPELTLQETADKFKVCVERIRQIEANAIRKLKHPSRSRKLRTYSGV